MAVLSKLSIIATHVAQSSLETYNESVFLETQDEVLNSVAALQVKSNKGVNTSKINQVKPQDTKNVSDGPGDIEKGVTQKANSPTSTSATSDNNPTLSASISATSENNSPTLSEFATFIKVPKNLEALRKDIGGRNIISSSARFTDYEQEIQQKIIRFMAQEEQKKELRAFLSSLGRVAPKGGSSYESIDQLLKDHPVHKPEAEQFREWSSFVEKVDIANLASVREALTKCGVDRRSLPQVKNVRKMQVYLRQHLGKGEHAKVMQEFAAETAQAAGVKEMAYLGGFVPELEKVKDMYEADTDDFRERVEKAEYHAMADILNDSKVLGAMPSAIQAWWKDVNSMDSSGCIVTKVKEHLQILKDQKKDKGFSWKKLVFLTCLAGRRVYAERKVLLEELKKEGPKRDFPKLQKFLDKHNNGEYVMYHNLPLELLESAYRIDENFSGTVWKTFLWQAKGIEEFPYELWLKRSSDNNGSIWRRFNKKKVTCFNVFGWLRWVASLVFTIDFTEEGAELFVGPEKKSFSRWLSVCQLLLVALSAAYFPWNWGIVQTVDLQVSEWWVRKLQGNDELTREEIIKNPSWVLQGTTLCHATVWLITTVVCCIIIWCQNFRGYLRIYSTFGTHVGMVVRMFVFASILSQQPMQPTLMTELEGCNGPSAKGKTPNEKTALEDGKEICSTNLRGTVITGCYVVVFCFLAVLILVFTSCKKHR